MTVKRSSVAAPQSIAVLQTEPLGLAGLRYVRDALAEFAPEWSVELGGICTEEATLIVVPEGGDDLAGPSFIVSRANFGYRLDLVHWDRMQSIGLFPDLADVMVALQQRLSFDVARLHAEQATLH
ncbi:MAG: hypothetical protein U1E70_13615 [Acetobacteraceae bacterium]|nr:hypothetical protein [Pseudomonadota bacterium]